MILKANARTNGNILVNIKRNKTNTARLKKVIDKRRDERKKEDEIGKCRRGSRKEQARNMAADYLDKQQLLT